MISFYRIHDSVKNTNLHNTLIYKHKYLVELLLYQQVPDAKVIIFSDCANVFIEKIKKYAKER